MRNQQKDKNLINIAQNYKDYSIHNFHGADKKFSLIPKQSEKQVAEWYQNSSCHPGETHTELSISQYFYWKNLRKTAHEIFTRYKMCQFRKRNKKQYGKLPPKDAENIPWDALCVDLIGKYLITPKGGGKKF